MFTKTYTYENYIGETRTKTVRFQLNKVEVLELASSEKGGFESAAQRMIEEHDDPKIFANFQKIILMAYGELSPDGDRFMKSPEISKAFSETPVYEKLFEELISDPNKMNEFIIAVSPRDSSEEVRKALIEYAKDNPYMPTTVTTGGDVNATSGDN